MAIFPVLATESVVQAGDKTRLDASRTFISPDEDAITKVEICPDYVAPAEMAPDENDYYDVYSSSSQDLWFLDWAYEAGEDSDTRTIRLRITTTPFDDNTAPEEDVPAVTETVDFTISVKLAEDDNLFSQDADLTSWEPDLFKYLKDGRATFMNVHREAQTQILDWLDRHEIWDDEDERLTSAAVVDVQEVKEWSKFLTLQIIFESLANASDDVFSKKAAKYAGKAEIARARAVVKLDRDGDGTAENDERTAFNTIRVVRT